MASLWMGLLPWCDFTCFHLQRGQTLKDHPGNLGTLRSSLLLGTGRTDTLLCVSGESQFSSRL